MLKALLGIVKVYCRGSERVLGFIRCLRLGRVLPGLGVHGL